MGGTGRGTKPEKPVDGIGAADGAITPGSAQGDRVHATDASSAHAAGGPSITCAASIKGLPTKTKTAVPQLPPPRDCQPVV